MGGSDPKVPLLGYGSLLSVRGMRDGSESLVVADPRRAFVPGVGRGLGLHQRSGRPDQRLAMVLEVGSVWPLQSRPLPLGLMTPKETGVGMLQLHLRPRDLSSLGGRLGCHGLVVALQERSGAQDIRPLLDRLAGASASFEDYQRALAAEAGCWSGRYVPVPVRLLEASQSAYLFVSPTLTIGQVGPERAKLLRSLPQALEAFGDQPNGQVEYYRQCVLGGVHGVPVVDLLAASLPQGRVHYDLLNSEIADAVATWFDQKAADYKATLGLPQMNIHLSGLEHILDGLDDPVTSEPPERDPAAPARF